MIDQTLPREAALVVNAHSRKGQDLFDQAQAGLEAAGIHIALAGHFHRTYAEAADRMVAPSGHSLIIQAGTATSTRLRNNEPQSFNWLHVRRYDQIELQVVVWDGSAFKRGSHIGYRMVSGHWAKREVADRVRPGQLSRTMLAGLREREASAPMQALR